MFLKLLTVFFSMVIIKEAFPQYEKHFSLREMAFFIKTFFKIEVKKWKKNIRMNLKSF